MGSDPLVRDPPAQPGPGPLGGDAARETLALGDDGQGRSGRGRQWLCVGSKLPLLAHPSRSLPPPASAGLGVRREGSAPSWFPTRGHEDAIQTSFAGGRAGTPETKPN